MASITERVGDIFDSPPNSILIHACNTKGSWGAGVAAAFKKYSPAAFNYQKHHCITPVPSTKSIEAHQKSLVGTCLLISPFPAIETPNSPHPAPAKSTPQQQAKKYWIACLFTSSGYGKKVDTPGAILDATKRAIAELRMEIRKRKVQILENEQMKQACEKSLQLNSDDTDTRRLLARCEEKTEVIRECYSVRINSGLFGVPWADTKKVLKRGLVDMVVVRPASQKDEVVGSDDDDDPYAWELHQKIDGMKTVECTERDQEERRQHIEEETPIAGAARSQSINKGLKRKSGEDNLDEETSRKKRGGGRQMKLNFGKSK